MTVDQLHEAVVAECTPEKIATWPAPPTFKTEYGYTTYGYGGYLAYIAAAVKVLQPKVIVELGTQMGRGATALATFTTVDQAIFTYNIQDEWACPPAPNIQRVIHNILDDTSSPTRIYAQADFIFLDVDPHDGEKEKSMLKLLQYSWPADKTVWMFFDDIAGKVPGTEGMADFWAWFIAQPGVEAKTVSESLGIHGEVCGFGIAKITT